MQVVTEKEIESAEPGTTLAVAPDALVTPLAEAAAQARNIGIVRHGPEAPSPTLIRQVARQVAARLQGAAPEVMEAVVAEVISALAVPAGAGSESVVPGVDFCAACLEQDRARARRRAVLTTTGKNQKGIAATVTARIAELGGDIIDISQTLVGDYFTMIIIVDTATLEVPFEDFRQAIESTIHEMGLQSMVMLEDVLTSLHRV